jgi:hypothetical protein
MASKYTVTYHGIDGRAVKGFSTLAAVQQYVKDRWEGPDYMDGTTFWHNDYGHFTLKGCTLLDLGNRRSWDTKSDDYWVWDWKQL